MTVNSSTNAPITKKITPARFACLFYESDRERHHFWDLPWSTEQAMEADVHEHAELKFLKKLTFSEVGVINW